MPAHRIRIDREPFPGFADAGEPWHHHRGWPADWIAPPTGADARPAVWRYRLELVLEQAQRLRIHVSADERYELELDGQRIGDGPERCSPERWAFETYELDLAAGAHAVEAVVWSCGPQGAPWPQQSIRHGFLCAADDQAWTARLSTGSAPWRVQRLHGHALSTLRLGMGAGWIIDHTAAPGPWESPVAVEPGIDEGVTYCKDARHLLRPALLPAMERTVLAAACVFADARDGDAVCEPAGCDRRLLELGIQLAAGRPVTLAAGQRLRALIDLGTYRAWNVEADAEGDGSIRVTYAEAPVLADDPVGRMPPGRGRRDVWAGCRIRGLADAFTVGTSLRTCRPLWWRAGRWALVELHAGATPLRVAALRCVGTGYPLTVAATYDDGPLERMCLASARACLHETYMDCPFYEQLQYIGDTRIQALLTLALSHDDRPVRAAIAHAVASARNQVGWITSNHPAGGGQVIPPFALIAIGMVHDLHRWRDCRADLPRWLPALRATAERFLLERDGDLVRSPAGWNFIDAEGPGMRWGIPAGGRRGGTSTAVNALFLRSLRDLAELESAAGEPELAARWTRHADAVHAALAARCWDGRRLRDAPGDAGTGPHAQILGLLAGAVPGSGIAGVLDELLADPAALPVGVMFSHYLCEAAALHGRFDRARPLWRRWEQAIADGYTSTPETWTDTRSDCHAWGAHPLLHRLTSLAGIRPEAPAFARVRVAPSPHDGERVRAAVPHPSGGVVAVDVVRSGERLHGTVTLPPGLSGTLLWGAATPLAPGRNAVDQKRQPAPTRA